MAKHLTQGTIRNARTCPMKSVRGPVEVIVVRSSVDKTEYEIPRMCLEFLHIEVGDPRESTYWFRREDSDRIRKHLKEHQ